MLSRVAESIYWMSRYLERAGNIARFLEANWRLSLDLPEHYGEQWNPLVMTTGDHAWFKERYGQADRDKVIRFLLFDTDYFGSVRSCLRAARENARTVREIIPTEMWEQINTCYHFVERASKSEDRIVDDPFNFCERLKTYDLTLGGISMETMARDEAWRFFRLARLLERADKTSRLLDVKYFTMLPSVSDVGTNLDYVQWVSLLTAISGFQAYRHQYGRIRHDLVVEFLLLSRDFPRAVLHCLTEAQHYLHAITGTSIGLFSNAAEKRLGLLCAELSYHQADDIFTVGLHEFTDNLQLRMNSVDNAVFETFFAPMPCTDPDIDEHARCVLVES